MNENINILGATRTVIARGLTPGYTRSKTMTDLRQNADADTGRGIWAAGPSNLTRLAEDACGVDVQCLRAGQTVVIRTRFSTYRVQLTDPDRRAGVAGGDGSHLIDPTDVTIVGASLNGCGAAVIHGRVLMGFRLIIACAGSELVTSRVHAISVDGMPWFSEYRSA